jgi:hypothetical protein
VRARVTPATAGLTAAQKATMKSDVTAAIEASIEHYGIGETIVYHRLLADIMAIEGIYDVELDVYPTGAAANGRVNLAPSPIARRPKVQTADVVIRGALVALDFTVTFNFVGDPIGDPDTLVSEVKSDLVQKLATILTKPGLGSITPTKLEAELTAVTGTTYTVQQVAYKAELLEDGLRVLQNDITIDLAGDQQPWVRGVTANKTTGVST